MELLSEALVFPKHPELLKCEALIQSIKDEMGSSYTYDRIAVSKNLTDIETILARFFGFYGVSLSIPPPFKLNGKVPVITGLDLPNAFTVKTNFLNLGNYIFDSVQDTFEVNDNHLKFKKDIRPFAIIKLDSTLFSMKSMTAAEIMSILLHEVGHNFYRGSYLSCAASLIFIPFQIIYAIVDFLCNFLLTLIPKSLEKNFVGEAFNFIYTLSESILKEISAGVTSLRLSYKTISKLDSPIITKLFGSIEYFFKIIETIYTIFVKWHKNLNPIGALLTLNSNISSDFLNEEKFADEFAGIHGYGPDLVSALPKITNVILGSTKDYKTVISDEDLFDMMNFSVVSAAAVKLTDTHPESLVSRPAYLRDFYRKQLVYAATPKEKEFINQQIAKLDNSNLYLQIAKNVYKGTGGLVQTEQEIGKIVNNSILLDQIKDTIASALKVDSFNSEALAKKLGA